MTLVKYNVVIFHQSLKSCFLQFYYKVVKLFVLSSPLPYVYSLILSDFWSLASGSLLFCFFKDSRNFKASKNKELQGTSKHPKTLFTTTSSIVKRCPLTNVQSNRPCDLPNFGHVLNDCVIPTYLS